MTHGRSKRLLAIVVACVVALSMTAPFVGAMAPGQQAGQESIGGSAGIAQQSIDGGQSYSQSELSGPSEQSASPDQPGATIDPTLKKAKGTVEVVVRLGKADVPMTASRQATVQSLKSHAQRTQQPVLRFAKKKAGGVKVLNRLWIANAVLLEVDKSKVSMQRIARIEGVKRLHANFELSLPKPVKKGAGDGNFGAHGTKKGDTTAGADANYNTTYGLDQINATEVWSEYGTMGQGVKVAVLDTGVDIDHPDIDLYTTNESNETYPGGWAEFDSNGNRVPGSVPHDSAQHGTHTSGTVSGGNASGEYIGVAPKVSLMHGLVIPGGSGTFTQVAAGMQWAAANGADVVSMSLGATGYYPAMIEPTQNIKAAGAILVASAGNSYEGSSGSPANVYGAVAIGASNEDLGIAPFSSGEVVDTSADWGSAAPEYWPDSYVVPDVSAPGVAVKSSIPGGGYAEYDGTSMAAPHTAGTVALMLSAAGGDLPNGVVKSALFETAFKPDECSPSCDPRDGNDTRYGAGIIDAKAATDRVALENGITGTVSDTNDTPVEGATVSIPSFSDETNASGQYTLLAEPGTYEVTASAFGYENATATVTVENGTFTTQNFTLADALGVRLLSGQPNAVQAGNSASVTVEVANLDTYTAELTGNYSAEDATLYVNGNQQPFGEPISLGGYSGEVNITVDTAPGTSGEFSIHHTFQGEGDTTEVTTGPTEVFEEFTKVAVVHSDSGYGDQVVTVLEEKLPANYQMTLVADQNAMEAVGEYDTFVVQDVDPSNLDVQAFVEATDSPTTGVVWLDNWGSGSNSIEELSDATGDPASRSESFDGSSPVYYNVTQNHPIFEGVAEPGETVDIHTAFFSDRSWFNDYSGRVIATVGAQNSDEGGPAVAVDPQTGTVLAATLGRESFVQNEDFTEAADQILANSVEYASTTPNVVLTSGQPRQIEPGEEAQLTFTVSDLKTVQVELADSSTLTEEDLSLYINGTGPIPFGLTILERPPVTTGNYTITVATDEDAVGSFSLVSTFSAGENCRLYSAAERKLTASGERLTVVSEGAVTANKQCSEISVETGPTAVYTPPLNVPGEVSTIQQAVDLAPPGAEIVVADGTYTESVTVDKANLTLRAAEGATPVIEAPANVTDSSVVDITAPNVTFKGFTVEAGGTNDGVTADEVADVTVDDVSVQNADTGIGIDRSDDATVENSAVTNATTGIVVSSANDAVVENNTISDADTGIGIDLAVDSLVSDNTVTNSATGIAVTSFSDRTRVTSNVIENGDTGIYIADTSANVTLNDVDAATGVHVDDLSPDEVNLRYNDLASTDVAVNSTVEGPFDARLNYYGERGPVNTTVEGDVVYDPFLTAPPEQVDRDETTQIATDLTMAGGDAYAVGVPGPTEQTVGDIFSDFEGTVYGYDAQSGSWEQLSANSEVGALDALYVQADTDARAVLSFQSSGPVPPAPGQKELMEGYNFIAPPKYAPIEEAYAVSSADLGLAMDAFTQPASQLGSLGELDGIYQFGSQPEGPNVSAFTGHYIFAESGGLVPAQLQANPTMVELYDALSVDMDVTDESNTALVSAQKIDITSVARQAEAATGETPPVPPAAYHGQVKRNGHAVSGATVTVKIDGEVRGTATTGPNGRFGAASAFGEKLLVSGAYSEAGSSVQFFVNGRPVDAKVTFQPGDVANVTLSLDRARGRMKATRRSSGPRASATATNPVASPAQVVPAQPALAVSTT